MYGTSGSFVAMPSQYGAVGGYGGYGGYGSSTPSYGYSTPSYGYSTPSYGYSNPYASTHGYNMPAYGTGMNAGNPLLDHMPMGYLGVGTAEEKPKTEVKKTRSVTLKKKKSGCC